MQFPVDEFQEDEEFKTRLSQWVHPPQNYRPLKDGQLSSSESEAKACPQDADDREESEAMKRMRGNGL